MYKKIKIISMIAVLMATVFVAGCIDNGESILFESYTEMKSTYKNVYGDYWTGQTFTIGSTGDNESHFIDKVNLYVSKVGIPNGDFIVSIRETSEKYPDSGWYIPVGEDLTYVSVESKLLPDVVPEWIEFDFENTKLEAGKTYAIVVGAPDANETAFPRWERVRDEGNYSGGTAVSSSDGGVNWGIILLDDYLFEEYGIKE